MKLKEYENMFQVPLQLERKFQLKAIKQQLKMNGSVDLNFYVFLDLSGPVKNHQYHNCRN